MAEGLTQLKQLAIAHSRKTHPDLPDYARCTRSYSDKTANGLQRAIIDFLVFSGHQCERIAVTGRYIDNTKVVTDCLGHKRKIGSGKWIKGSMQPGSADLSATIRNKSGLGISVKIEVKIKDYQSDSQKVYQEQIERAGGIYMIIRSFPDFLRQYKELI